MSTSLPVSSFPLTNTMLVLHDIVLYPGGPFSSPVTIRVRLALLHKGVSFRVKELTYAQLRNGDWREKVGADERGRVTVPFIEKEDGSYLRDSFEIWRWLDSEYPDRPNIYLPDAPLPVNVSSKEYLQAVEDFALYKESARGAMKSLIRLYAPKLVSKINKNEPDNDYDYITSSYSFAVGQNEWDTLVNANPEELISVVNKEIVAPLEDALSVDPVGRIFVTSPSSPGAKDFAAMGVVRTLAASDANIHRRLFGNGNVGKWVERMNTRFASGTGDGMDVVRSRDA